MEQLYATMDNPCVPGEAAATDDVKPPPSAPVETRDLRGYYAR